LLCFGFGVETVCEGVRFFGLEGEVEGREVGGCESGGEGGVRSLFVVGELELLALRAFRG
jgi:hypothetical protein